MRIILNTNLLESAIIQNPYALNVLMYLIFTADDYGVVAISKRAISRNTKISYNKVNESINLLVSQNLIGTLNQTQNAKSIFTINLSAVADATFPKKEVTTS